LLSADYSQLELRLMAHFSQDPLLLKILHSGGDLFNLIASVWLGKPTDEISKVERNRAKGMCYGILYGMGVNSLADRLEVSPEEAARFMDAFKSKYAGVTKFIAQLTQECRKKGYVKTIAGRKRYFPTINSSNTNEARAAERCAVNTICQGSAADLMKIAMINIHRRFEEMWKNTFPCDPYGPSSLSSSSPSPSSLAPHITIQIHDELLLDVPKGSLSAVKDIVKFEMENAVKLTVPMKVNMFTGESWGKMEPLT